MMTNTKSKKASKAKTENMTMQQFDEARYWRAECHWALDGVLDLYKATEQLLDFERGLHFHPEWGEDRTQLREVAMRMRALSEFSRYLSRHHKQVNSRAEEAAAFYVWQAMLRPRLDLPQEEEE